VLRSHIADEKATSSGHESEIKRHEGAIAKHEQAGNKADVGHASSVGKDAQWNAEHESERVSHEKLMQAIRALKAVLD